VAFQEFRGGKPCTDRKTAPKNDDPTRFLPIGVRKSYFLLSKADRDVLNIALGKYQPAKSQPILVGGARLLKPALRLLTLYRLRIDEIRDGKAVTSYTRWLEAVQVKDESVSVTLDPRFKRIWLEVKKRLTDSVEQTASPGFRSQSQQS
jgi:hypothetical protein